MEFTAYDGEHLLKQYNVSSKEAAEHLARNNFPDAQNLRVIPRSAPQEQTVKISLPHSANPIDSNSTKYCLKRLVGG